LRVLLLAILALSIIIPVLVDDVFAELTVVETASRDEVELQKWYNDSWEFRKEITLSLNTATGVGSDLTDFPVLISFTDTELIQTKESLGRDFVFTESDGKTVLSHEIEKFDNTTGELIAWVKLPTMSASSTTDIYIYYKGDTIGFNSADVWNDDYVLVWHLNQTSTGTVGEFRDATSNSNDGRGGGGNKVGYNAVRIPHLTDGQIGTGQQLKGPTTTGSGEGTGDMIWTHSLIQGMPSRDVTIELWVGDITNSPGTGSNYNDMVGFCTTHTNQLKNQWSNHLVLWKAKDITMAAKRQHYVSNVGINVEGNNAASFTNWNHIVAVYNMKDADGTVGASNLYVNGVLAASQTKSQNDNVVLRTTDLRMVLGGDIDGASGNNCAKVNNELKGKVDELRISSGLRTADYAAATYYNQADPDTYTTVDVEETRIEMEKTNDCYDCEAPKLTRVEVHITSPNSDTQRISTSSEIWNFDQDTPLPMFGDSITPIVADPGDEIEIILELTDNRTLKTITDSGTYTNFLNKPDDMNLFYANNFDEYGKVSTTFYEWYQTSDDLFYDYANTVEWSEADVTIQESGEFVKDEPVENLDELIGTFTISFKMKFLQPMQTTDVWIQVTDLNGNFFKVALPLTLEISGSEPLVFDSPLRQKVVSFFDEEMLAELVSNWDGSSQDVAELELLIGIPAESVPKWVVNLATWVSEDKITTGEMIVAIEHIINN